MPKANQPPPAALDPVHDECARILAARHYKVDYKQRSDPPSWEAIYEAARLDHGACFGCANSDPTWDEIGAAAFKHLARRRPILTGIMRFASRIQDRKADPEVTALKTFRSKLVQRLGLPASASFAEYFQGMIRTGFAKEAQPMFALRRRQ